MLLCLSYIFSIIFLFSYAVQLNQPFMLVVPFSGLVSNNAFYVAYFTLLLFFYCGAVYFTFRAYKEFKGCYQDINGLKGTDRNPFHFGKLDEDKV